jgi:hypothetical protein
MALGFIGAAQLVDFHEKSFYHELLHSAGLPENAFRVNVEMEMAGFDGADGSGFFGGFAFCGLAVREARFRRAFREGPLIAAVGVDKQELDRVTPAAKADRGHLQRQRFRNAG